MRRQRGSHLFEADELHGGDDEASATEDVGFVLLALLVLLERVGELLLCPLVCAVCFDDRLKLVPLAQQPRRAGRIIIQIRRGQAHFQLVEPRGQHFQFLKHNLSPNRAIHQRPVSISPIMEQYSRQRTAAH